MLLLTAAFGLIFWDARRRLRRRSSRKAAAWQTAEEDLLKISCLTPHEVALSSRPSRSNGVRSLGREIAHLKQDLLSADALSAEPELLERALRQGAKALPALCSALNAPVTEEVLAEVTELLALLSPSRWGLQTSISDAGAVPALLRILAQAAPAHAHARAPAAPYLHGSLMQVQNDGGRSPGPLTPGERLPEQEKGRRTSPGGALSSSRGEDSTSPASTAVLSYVLRTLVNLTSGRTGVPVRQAILRDCAALDALLGLLHVPEEEQEEQLEEEEGLGLKAAADEDRSSGRCASRPGAAAAARWHTAGLAAWLVAHLCSVSVGQIQLVQEGVVPVLVRLVRRGRMACAAAATAAAAAAAGASAACYEGQRRGRRRHAEAPPVHPPSSAGTAAHGHVAPGGGGAAGLLLPHASSTQLYDAAVAAAAAAGTPLTSVMPYMMASIQYGLMALVNITFENSANQRAVAMSGMLAELDALFGLLLLQPGVLLPRPQPHAVVTASPPYRAGGAGGAGADPFSAVPAAAAPMGQRQPMGVFATGAAGGGVADGAHRLGNGYSSDSEAAEAAEAAQVEAHSLLRGGYLGVAKFAVWLMAHLSSSDPDLKADVAGPAFSFVPRLLDFLLLPDPDSTQQSPQQQRQQVRPSDPPGARSCDVAAAPSASPTPASRGNSDSGCRERTVVAASGGVLVVRQYAAMALVNLTCGVPSTKTAVARAMDWGRVTELLSWLAEESAAAGAAAASAPGPSGSSAPGPGPGPISDVLLYTVWLVQHLSLSPVAAAAADPRVVPPLVALLDAPEPHVRLRASAAIGALCSAAMPADEAAATAAAGGGAGGGSSQPHRAAFLAAGGVQRLLAAARRERDPHLLAYGMLCLASGVGNDNLAAVAEAVGGGALGLLEGLMVSDHAACLLPAAEALQALARAACLGLRMHGARAPAGSQPAAAATNTTNVNAAAEAAAAAAVAAAADHVPRSLLSRVVAVMLTHADPGVRAAMNEALGLLAALPGVRERYCAVVAETLRDLVSAAEVELQVIPVN